MITACTIVLTSFMEALVSLMLIRNFMNKRDNAPDWLHFAGVAAITAMIVLSNNLFKHDVGNAVGMIVSIFLVSFIYRGKVVFRLILSVLAVAITGLTEIIILYILAFVMGVSATDIVNSEITRLLGGVLSKIAGYIVVKIICLRGNSFAHHTSTYWAMFFVIFLSPMLTIFAFFQLSYNNPNEDVYNLAAVSSIVLLFSSCLALYLYELMLKQADEIRNKNVLEELVKSQTKHIDEVLLNQKRLKKFRHDIKNHCVALKGYFIKNDTEGGLNYLEFMNKTITPYTEAIDTGNITLDAILNSKKALAESKDINFDINIRVPENINVSPEDVCIIFGNALDNAIEANEKLPAQDRYIKLSLVYDNALFCKIENACIASRKFGFITTKRDKSNHGFGIENIKTALNKYKSVFNINQNKNKFTLTFQISC